MEFRIEARLFQTGSLLSYTEAHRVDAVPFRRSNDGNRPNTI